MARAHAEPERILVVGPTWVGDLAMATANLAALRKTFPRAHIAIVVRPGRDGIIAGSTDVDEVIVDRSRRTYRGLWRLAGELRPRRFDLALLFPNSWRSAMLAFAARIPRRVGYRRDGRGVLLTDPIDYEREGPRRRPVPMPLFYGKLLEAVGVELDDTRPRLVVTPDCERRADELRSQLGIEPGERLVGLNPGASFGASKLWPPAQFARLADLLHERTGLRAIIFLGPGEEPIGHAIESHMTTPVVNTAASILDLDTLKPLVRDLALMVSTDTGPRQYAVAFDIPTVVVMGPTDPRYSGINLERSIVVRHDVDCGPCHLKTCPTDHHCMTGITPEEVLEAALELDRRFQVF